MTVTRFWILLAMLIMAAGLVAAEEVRLEQFQVITRAGQIDGVDGVFDGRELRGSDGHGASLAIPAGEIRSLYAYRGTQAGSYALKGAGIGLLGSLLGVLSAANEASSDPYTEVDNDRVVPIVVGFTVGGAVIGAMIGSGKKVRERVPLRVGPTVSARDGAVGFVMTMPL